MKKNLLLLLLVCVTLVSYAQTGKEKRLAKLINKGKNEKALRRANDLIRKTNSAKAYHLRGYYFSLINESALALEDYDKSIELDPTYVHAYFDRAHSHFVSGQSDKAVEDYNKVIQIDPNFVEAYLNRGTVRLEQGNTRGACRDWDTAGSLGLEFAYEIMAVNCEGY
ncbi:MAG: tetratricopeptide repeat protein [Bacteroidota bacterium]